MSGWIPWAVIVVLAGLCALCLRGERTVARRRVAEVVAALAQLAEEVGVNERTLRRAVSQEPQSRTVPAGSAFVTALDDDRHRDHLAAER